MAKFYGVIGYGHQVETAPGVWDEDITERTYQGDVVRNVRNSSQGDQINNDLTVNNSISVVADAYAQENFFAIRYIKWMGALWTVSSVDVQSPRLLLSLGGVYHGPTPSAPVAP